MQRSEPKDLAVSEMFYLFKKDLQQKCQRWTTMNSDHRDKSIEI